MIAAARQRMVDPRPAWFAAALLSVAIGSHYLLTEPLIFEPGGWFALDGRRVLDAATAVAIVLAAPLTLIPAPIAIIGWISASAVVAGALVGRALDAFGVPVRALAIRGGSALSGVALGILCVAFLRSRGGIDLGFVGSYGLTKMAPALALPPALS